MIFAIELKYSGSDLFIKVMNLLYLGIIVFLKFTIILHFLEYSSIFEFFFSCRAVFLVFLSTPCNQRTPTNCIISEWNGNGNGVVYCKPRTSTTSASTAYSFYSFYSTCSSSAIYPSSLTSSDGSTTNWCCFLAPANSNGNTASFSTAYPESSSSSSRFGPSFSFSSRSSSTNCRAHHEESVQNIIHNVECPF